MLVRMLYVSRSATPLTNETVNAILAQSRENNPALGITGILCHTGATFLQVLEGGRDAVNTLYAKLMRDPRHNEITLLHYEEIAERRFNGWTMGMVNLAKTNPALLLKYSEQSEFDPYRVPGRAAMALLDELICTAAIVGRS